MMYHFAGVLLLFVKAATTTAPEESGSFPLAFGVEFEYLFPERMAQADKKKRNQATAGALEGAVMPLVAQADEKKRYQETAEILEGAVVPLDSPRFPLIVFDDYYEFMKVHGKNVEQNVEQWKLVPDASLYGPAGGFELVSPVISKQVEKKEFLKELDVVLRTLEEKVGATVNEVTGLHVHVDVTDRSLEEIRNIYKNFIYFEDALDSLQPPNRQGNKAPHSRSLARNFPSLLKAFQALDRCDFIDCLGVQTARNEVQYQKLIYAKHDANAATVEFRGHHGTFDVTTVEMWISLVTTLVHKSINDGAVASKGANRGSLEELLALLFPSEEDRASMHNFYKKHIAMLQIQAEDANSIYARPILRWLQCKGKWGLWEEKCPGGRPRPRKRGGHKRGLRGGRGRGGRGGRGGRYP